LRDQFEGVLALDCFHLLLMDFGFQSEMVRSVCEENWWEK
jgi:hypothetical protein